METCLWSTSCHLDPPDLPWQMLQRLRPCSWQRTDRSGWQAQRWEAKYFALRQWWFIYNVKFHVLLLLCWCLAGVGGAGVLPPASNTSTALHVSPGKKTRGSSSISAPSTMANVHPMFSVPLMPNAVPHPLTAVDATCMSYYPRPSESFEQIQRNQLLQQQMLLAAGQQLTPVICFLPLYDLLLLWKTRVKAPASLIFVK